MATFGFSLRKKKKNRIFSGILTIYSSLFKKSSLATCISNSVKQVKLIEQLCHSTMYRPQSFAEKK